MPVLAGGKVLCWCGVMVAKVDRDDLVIMPSGDHHGEPHHPRISIEDLQEAALAQRSAWMRPLTPVVR